MAGSFPGICGKVFSAPGQARLACGVHGGQQHTTGQGDVLEQLVAARVPAFLAADVGTAPLNERVQP
jgi:hypothetical protein